MINLAKSILRRKLFKGQFRLFLWLYGRQKLKVVFDRTSPITGNFLVNVHTKNFIDACIYYMGDYEPYLKHNFKKLIKPGDVVFDIGANIGFHTLYFAELVGNAGKVYAIEPIDINFKALTANLALNPFTNIIPVNKAFGNKTESINIHINVEQTNPGAFSITAEGPKNTIINCIKGDEYVKEFGIEKVDVLKIDVEGFEFEVLKGLSTTINKHKPIIFFEYDRNYQLRSHVDPKSLFDFLADQGYQFYQIDAMGNQLKYVYSESTTGAEILAIADHKLIVAN